MTDDLFAENGVLALLRRFWLRVQPNAQMRRMRVVEQMTLGRGRTVALLTVDGCHYLMGGSNDGVTCIVEVRQKESCQ